MDTPASILCSLYLLAASYKASLTAFSPYPLPVYSLPILYPISALLKFPPTTSTKLTLPTILSSEFYMLKVLQYFKIGKIKGVRKIYLKF